MKFIVILTISNLRLLDCINRPKDLINRAIELVLAGIAITDHEALCGHIENKYVSTGVIKKNILILKWL